VSEPRCTANKGDRYSRYSPHNMALPRIKAPCPLSSDLLWTALPQSVCNTRVQPPTSTKAKRVIWSGSLSTTKTATADRAARVAFIVATSASWKETLLALRQDVTPDLSMALIRGTKRQSRFRTVPIVSEEAVR
jgi:hypothetical protein